MTLEELQGSKHIIFDSISGSRAYGTDLPTSDEDLRGVFILPKSTFYGLQYTPQVSDATNDIVYYEVGRFVELLLKNNPNMLELLAMPKACIRHQNPIYDIFNPSLFLSKKCLHTFAGYAMTQVKKARGLNKKIVNPVSKERKTVLDFCFIVKDHGSISLKKWLAEKGYQQENCGLVNIEHIKDVYAIFHDTTGILGYKGVIKKATAHTVALSSIPKGEKSVAIFSFNKDGYTAYCKQYKQYWEWVEKRNDERYKNTISHGKNYDAKNMLHTFRLLDMAAEIAQYKEIRVRRPNREFLLDIRKGKFDYDDLVEQAEAKINKIETLYAQSDLPDAPDAAKVNQLLVDIRERWYK